MPATKPTPTDRLWHAATRLLGDLDGRDVRAVGLLSRIRKLEKLNKGATVKLIEILELMAEMRGC